MPNSHRYRMWLRLSRGLWFRRLAAGFPEMLTNGLARAVRALSGVEKRRVDTGSTCFSRDELDVRFSGGADVIVAGHFHSCVDGLVDVPSGSGRRLVVLGSWDDCRGAHALWDGTELTVVAS
jgi:hypothetical protein